MAAIGAPGAKSRSKFADSEIQILQRLVHQECRNGRISESKLRRVYGDIFPMVDSKVQRIWNFLALIFREMQSNMSN